MINKPMAYVYTSQTILMSTVTLLSITVTTPTLPLAVGCPHLTPETQG